MTWFPILKRKDLRLRKGRDLPKTHSRGGRQKTQEPDLWSALGSHSQGSRPASWCQRLCGADSPCWMEGFTAGADSAMQLGKESEGVFLIVQHHTRRKGHPLHQCPANFLEPSGDRKHLSGSTMSPSSLCGGHSTLGRGSQLGPLVHWALREGTAPHFTQHNLGCPRRVREGFSSLPLNCRRVNWEGAAYA